MRVSTTVLESFRLFMDQDFMEEAELLATIRGEFSPNFPIALGMSYHSIIETPDKYRLEGGDGYLCKAAYVDDNNRWQSREITFPAAVIDPMLALVDRRGSFELKATKWMDDCLVVVKADHVFGTDISELKTTLGQFDAEKYMTSCQWKFEALLLGASRVTYRVARLSDGRDGIELRAIENLAVYPYPEMENDCRALLRRFVDYCKVRKLDEFLRDKQRKAMGVSDGQLSLGGVL